MWHDAGARAERPFVKMHGLRNHFVIFDRRSDRRAFRRADIVRICDAQIAVEAQLKALIERGALADAARFAEIARYRTITYLEHVRTIIRDTRIDPDAHDWLTDVPAELKAALAHVAERISTEAELRSAVADRRDEITDPAARHAVNTLLATLGDCMHRNAQLQDHLIDARQSMRDAQDARFARRGTSQARYHLHADLTLGYLSAAPAAVRDAAERIFDHLVGTRRPFWLHWADLLEDLLEPPATDGAGERVEDPQFADDDEPPWWEPYWDVADALIAGITEPITLSQLLARIEPVTLDDGTAVDIPGIAAAVCHQAYTRRGVRLLDDDPGDDPHPILLAIPTGAPLDSPDATGDDLQLLPAVLVAPAGEAARRAGTHATDDPDPADPADPALEGTLL